MAVQQVSWSLLKLHTQLRQRRIKKTLKLCKLVFSLIKKEKKKLQNMLPSFERENLAIADI